MTHFKCWWNKNEPMHSSFGGTVVPIIGFLGKIRFLKHFYKSVHLVHYQLPFLQIGWFPGEMDWTGVQLDLESLPNVPDIWNPFQSWSTHRHRVFSWNIEVHSKSSPRESHGFCFEICLNVLRLLCPSQIHLAWKPTYFRETTTGSVNFGQHFYQNVKNIYLLQRIQWYYHN